MELPHHVANPFELLIADHCTHFAAATAAALLERAGLEIVSVAENWVPKELTLVARKPAAPAESAGTSPAAFPAAAVAPGYRARLPAIALASGSAGWARFQAWPASWRRSREIGLFGTSIAATWLFAELEGAVGFFVDEDPQRIGKSWQGRPVYHPPQIPQRKLPPDSAARRPGREHFPPHRPARS